MSLLPLSPDELLTTTRAVRKRLDFDRPVERSVIEECLQIAIQAPTGSNLQRWHFVVVTDQAKRRAIADLYRKSWATYLTSPTAATESALRRPDPGRGAAAGRRLGPVPGRPPRARAGLSHPVLRGADRRAAVERAGRHVGLDLAGRLELHAGRARPRPRHGLDHACACGMSVRSPRSSGSRTSSSPRRRSSRSPTRAARISSPRTGSRWRPSCTGTAGKPGARPEDAVRRGRPGTPRARSAHRRWTTGR